jgi:hypothetical protein
MKTKLLNAALTTKILKRRARVVVAACVLVVVSVVAPARAAGQERLKIIYSQLTMTNSVTWFAREAGLFERHRPEIRRPEDLRGKVIGIGGIHRYALCPGDRAERSY